MRIAKLELLAYGSFRGLVLDLEAPGLHVVFGRNEAGKSTTLRAIAGLLYGIERTTRDAYVHKPAELRIGGVLVGDDGKRVSVVRRKGNTNTLLDPKGEPLAEEVMTRLLRGISEETFRHAFGLDHDTLRRGAEALLAGKGDLGESLFDASVGGGGDVQRLRERLEKEADAIYRPRGSALPLNDAIKAFVEAQKSVRERQSLPEAFLTQEKHLAGVRTDLAAKLAARKELVARRGRLDAARQRAPLERKLATLVTARAELGDVADHPARLAGLDKRLGAYEVSARAQSELAAELVLARDRAVEAARRAGVQGAASEAGGDDAGDAGLRIDVKTEARLVNLLSEREKAAAQIGALGLDVEKTRRALAEAREAVTARALAVAPGDLPDEGALSLALSGARALGDAEARLSLDVSKLAKKRRELEARAAQAGLGTLSLEEVVVRALPPVEHVEALAQQAADLDRTASRLAEKVADLDGQALALEQQIAALAGDFAPPDVAELRASRAARDAAWQSLRAESAAGVAPRERVVIEGDVERAFRASDEIADRMIREAERVTTLARLRSAVATVVEQLAGKRAELEAARVARAGVDADLAASFARCGLAPASFAVARSIVTRAAQIRDQFLEIEDDVAASEELAATVAKARGALSRAMGHAEGESDEIALADLVARAVAVLEVEAARKRTAAETDREVARLAASAVEKEAALAAAREAEVAVRLRFAEVATPLGIAADASGGEVTRGLDALREVASARQRCTEVAARAEAAERDARAFEGDVARLAASHAPDVVALPARDAAAELVLRGLRAASVAAELASTRQRLEELGEVRLTEAEEPLAADADTALRAVADLDVAIAELDDAASRLQRDAVAVELGLAQMRGDSHAAEAAATGQEALARVRAHVERWCRAKVAATLLAREIDRYREENQGPLLSRASTLFSRLTLGAYQGVRAGFDDKDRPCLLCVRDDGAEVRVEALSEGTRDQLYLGLRLSSLERHADVASPMPLVLDDVLVQLDDERARAALVVLAEIATRTQVLFFTHHARLVELARAALDPALLHVHELTGPRAARAAEDAAV